MPCRQVSTYEGTTGSGKAGGGGHATEADCNQACREGACCEGTTCTVKPACQCKCASGSCCGPDTFTNSNGETGPRCRNESESACAARGGTWRCGVFCVGLQGDPFAGQPLGSGICTSLAGSPSTPVFKGVGTTCSPNPCLTGACCGNNSLVCSDTTQEACEAAGGRYQGNGTNCSTANCCPSAYNPSWVGSCCVTSRQNGPFAFRCYSMTKSQCASAGGLFSCAQRCSGDATQSDDLGFYGSCNQAGIDAGLFNDGNPLP
jgi:hypothetical protein